MSRTTKIALGVGGAVVAVIVVFILVAIMQRPTPSAQVDIDPGTGLASAIREDSHRLDDVPDAKVTVVEFLDFECEACLAFYPHVENIRETYAGQITYVLRYFPLSSHKNSQNAAIAVEAAALQGQMEAMYHRMFETQGQWGERQESQAALFRTFAEELGLDMTAYDADVADPQTLARVMSDFNDGLALGVTSTPTFFINDRKVELTAFGDLDAAIAAELAK